MAIGKIVVRMSKSIRDIIVIAFFLSIRIGHILWKIGFNFRFNNEEYQLVRQIFLMKILRINM